MSIMRSHVDDGHLAKIRRTRRGDRTYTHSWAVARVVSPSSEDEFVIKDQGLGEERDQEHNIHRPVLTNSLTEIYYIGTSVAHTGFECVMQAQFSTVRTVLHDEIRR